MRRELTFLILSVLVLSLVHWSPAQETDPSLVGWWKLDEGVGTTVADASAGGHDGVFASGSPEWVAGMYGNALRFDGESEVEIADHADFHLEEAISAALWARPEADQPDYAKLFIKQKSGEYPYAIQFNTDQEVYATINASTRFNSSPPLPNFPGEWAHLCLTYDGSDLILYKDAEAASEVAASGALQQNDLSLSIGGRLNSGQDFIGIIDDVRLFNRALTQEEISQIMTVPVTTTASNPGPADGTTDLPRADVVLGWTQAESADMHDVYLGTDEEAVAGAETSDTTGIYRGRQDTETYAPVDILELGRTYYWRIDEVGPAPELTVSRGEVWSFTIEPVAYALPGGSITASASSFSSDEETPDKTIDGSGMDADDLHSAQKADMWLSDDSDPGTAWIEFTFDKVYKLHQMLVWNHNSELEGIAGLGLKEAIVEYSQDGVDWVSLGETHEFARAPGQAGYASETTIPFDGVVAQHVRITPQSNWEGLFQQYGLSEVRFLYIPLRARQPEPASGAAEIPPQSALTWRAGREAALHEIYVSDDRDAVLNGTALAETLSEDSYDTAALDLQLGQTYYWKVDEVNEAEIPGLWEGDIWEFSTPAFFVVDDFESYDDDWENYNRIFQVWIDGAGYTTPEPGNPGNGSGSLVGTDAAPWVEEDVVHSGRKSMPLGYNNTAAPFYSEAERTFALAQDWTKAGVETLVLFFSGDPLNAGGEVYVTINGVKTRFDGDAAAIARPVWTQWNVDLASTGADLRNVTKLGVGVEGGDSGTLHVDDILLYRLAPPPPAQGIWLEAEAADVLGTSWRVVDDPTASGGQYIGSDDGDGTDNDAAPGLEWIAAYNFDVPGGVYKVMLRGQEATSDSFWVRIPTATSQNHEDPDQTGTGWVRFNGLDAPDGWNWDEVHSDDHNREISNWTLAAGSHTLEIGKREDGTWLDAIVIVEASD
jgi:hypothetical protein